MKLHCPNCGGGTITLGRKLVSSFRPVACSQCGTILKKRESSLISVFLGVLYIPLAPILIIWLVPKNQFGLFLGIVMFVVGIISILLAELVTAPMLRADDVKSSKLYSAGRAVGQAAKRLLGN
jgi:uncharacterized protein (DUF983 family)